MTVKNILNRITGESYWKERLVTAFMVVGYLVGNLVEMISGTVSDDPAIIWIAGVVIGTTVIVLSLLKNPSYKAYTSGAFKFFLFYLNFNVIYAYAGTLKMPDDKGEFFYMLFSDILFVVICFALESRKELILYTIAEIIFFTVAVALNVQYHPMLLDPMQIFTFGIVLGGNYMINLQRMRYSQISSDVSIQFKVISEQARDAQIILDNHLRFVYINPAASELAGYRMQELQKKSISEVVSEEDFVEIKSVTDKILATKDSRERLEYQLKSANGNFIWVESIFSSFAAKENSTQYLVFAETRNVEERKKMEAEIQQQMKVEEMLIKHSNQFINVERTEIQQNIDLALGEFGNMLNAEGVLVYRMHGKLEDEFRSTNQWFGKPEEKLNQQFNLVVKINQALLVFLRSMRGAKSSHGNFIHSKELYDIQVSVSEKIPGKKFYILPLQSGNVVNGFVVFLFEENAEQMQSSFFGLVGNMIASAFSRLRTELRLREAQLTNEFILRALPDWLYIVNKNSEFTGSNNYTSLEPYIADHDLMGRTFRDVLPAETAALFSDTLNKVMDDDVSSSFEFLDTTIQKGHYFKVIIAPFKANEYLVMIRDVTDLKLAEKELVSKARKLELSNKELEEFAYVVSHDLKQPTRTIVSYLNLLKKKFGGSLTEEAQQFIDFSIEGANKMSDLIRDILEYARLEQDVAMTENISVNKMLDKVCGILKEHIEKNNATVTVPEMPSITCNETMISEIFQNLIENGIKYNINEKRTIDISYIEHANEWEFISTDNGIGFDQKDADTIFKIFKRLPTEQEFQGTGIGLGICQKVIDKHGGKIWAISEKGKGSIFHFTIPKVPG